MPNTHVSNSDDNIPSVLIDIFRRPAGDAVLSVPDVLKALTNPPVISLLPNYADNAAARTGGLITGQLYRTGGDPDLVCIVHDAE